MAIQAAAGAYGQERTSIRKRPALGRSTRCGTASLLTPAAWPVTAGRDPRCRSDSPVIKHTARRRDDGTCRPPRQRAAAMLTDICPVQWTGRQAVIALPEHIDVSNAGPIREGLLSVINRGARSLIADLTATISCDHAGAAAPGPRPPAGRHQRHGAAAGGHRAGRPADTQPQRPGSPGLHLPVPAAATAARTPAAGIPVAAARPDGSAAAVTPAVAGKRVDAPRLRARRADQPRGRVPGARRPAGRSPPSPGRLRPGIPGPADGHRGAAGRAAQRRDHVPGRDQPQRSPAVPCCRTDGASSRAASHTRRRGY